MIKVKESKYRKSSIAIHFGKTVRHISLDEAKNLIGELFLLYSFMLKKRGII